MNNSGQLLTKTYFLEFSYRLAFSRLLENVVYKQMYYTLLTYLSSVSTYHLAFVSGGWLYLKLLAKSQGAFPSGSISPFYLKGVRTALIARRLRHS